MKAFGAVAVPGLQFLAYNGWCILGSVRHVPFGEGAIERLS